MNKPYFFQHFYLVNWRNKCLKNTIDLLLFYREHFYGFLKVSWRCLEDAFARHLEDVLKVSLRPLEKLSWRCLKDVFARRLEDILKTSWRSLEDVWPRQIYWSSSKRIEDALKPPSEDEGKCLLGCSIIAPVESPHFMLKYLQHIYSELILNNSFYILIFYKNNYSQKV